MTARSHANTVPRGALLLAGGLVGFTLLATIGFRAAGLDPAASPVAERVANRAQPLAQRTLVFADLPDGGVRIADADGAVTILPAGGQSGFIRGVMRGLARDRRMRGLGADAPFALTAWDDGSLSLADSATGRIVELNGFGPDNRAAFAALLEMPR
ncbi:photosynthetic complex assembly protein PuhC [Sphingomonas baiyangensis]|uniref:Phosphonoacetaldehyde methylase n=1 Tax=Sphingomonas baiyangensis TaxID=2572576 RepID=A0A4U1L250_9SPHN|nr:photosynthetic complex assembly protein PuhC [Sphingomonas baiyangensis]TKD50941.1 phosphonoacetaldehyde methylase [Sphingomonas baiyangensis]